MCRLRHRAFWHLGQKWVDRPARRGNSRQIAVRVVGILDDAIVRQGRARQAAGQVVFKRRGSPEWIDDVREVTGQLIVVIKVRARGRSGASHDAGEPPARVVGVESRRQAGDLLPDRAHERVIGGDHSPARRSRVGLCSRGGAEGADVRAAIIDIRLRPLSEAERIIRIGQDHSA